MHIKVKVTDDLYDKKAMRIISMPNKFTDKERKYMHGKALVPRKTSREPES